jgi:DNA-binding transcriptional LysR family regulator
MKLSIRQLRYICEIAHQGSVLGASKALNISQSSIVAALELAEAELGTRIFDRRPARGATLTLAGENFIVAARALVNAAQDFSMAISDQRARMPKLLRIGCFEPFGALFMPEVLQRFVAAAGQDVDIDLREGDQEHLRDWLLAGQIDFAVQYNIGEIAKGSITHICDVPPHALLHADDPLARERAVSISALAERPLILLNLPQTSSYLIDIFRNAPTQPRVRLHTRSYETVRAAVASGLGMSILNMRPMGRASQDGSAIVRRPIIDDLAPAPLILADMCGRVKPQHLRKFIETLRGFFREAGDNAFVVRRSESAPQTTGPGQL